MGISCSTSLRIALSWNTSKSNRSGSATATWPNLVLVVPAYMRSPQLGQLHCCPANKWRRGAQVHSENTPAGSLAPIPENRFKRYLRLRPQVGDQHVEHR